MATNEILNFAENATNIKTQSEYISDETRVDGLEAYATLSSSLFNKFMKQTALVSSGLSKFLSDNQDENITDSLTTGEYASAIQRAFKFEKIVTPEMFGAIDDGVTNCYQAFKDLFEYINLNNGVKVVFERKNLGIYYIDEIIDTGNTISDFEILDKSGFEIEGNGSEIRLKGGWTYNSASQVQLSFIISRCENYSINNLFINGNIENITKVTGTNLELINSGLVIKGGKNGIFKNVKSNQHIGDSLYLTRYGVDQDKPESLSFLNCEFSESANGALFVERGKFLFFQNTKFNNIGRLSFGSLGLNSFVIYPETTSDNGFIYFNNCEILNPVSNILFGPAQYLDNPILLDNCKISQDDAFPISAYLGLNSKFIKLNNCFVNNISYSIGPNTSQAQDVDTAIYADNCIFRRSSKNCEIISNRNSDGVYIAPICVITNSKIYLESNEPSDSEFYAIFLRGSRTTFKNNYVFIKSTEFPETGTRFLLLQSLQESVRNIFDTDLSVQKGTYQVGYDNIKYANDFTTKPSYIFGYAAANAEGTMFVGPISATQINTAFNKRIFYQQGLTFPSSGAYNQGDEFINVSPTAGSFRSIVCVAGGNPGTWKTCGPISA